MLRDNSIFQVDPVMLLRVEHERIAAWIALNLTRLERSLNWIVGGEFNFPSDAVFGHGVLWGWGLFLADVGVTSFYQIV